MMSEGGFGAHWVDALSDVPEITWNECFPEGDVMRSYAMQQVYEKSAFESVRFKYLLVSENQTGRVAGIFPCFFFQVSLTDVAPVSLQNFVGRVRKFWPRFLKIPALVCGSPIATCDDLFGIRPCYRAQSEQILVLGLTYIEQLSKTHKAKIIVVKEVRQRYKRQLLGVLPSGFIVVESPPTCFAYVGPKDNEGYIKSFRNRYRSSIKGYVNKFNKSNLRWELVDDFTEHAEVMCKLYLNVLNNSSVKFETLTPEFFLAVNDILGSRSTALLCYSGNELIAMELILQDKAMHPIYLGMDYRHLKNSGLYFNCLIRLLEEAEKRGSYIVELGQTSYEAKSNFGIRMEKLYVAIKYNSIIVNLFLRKFKNLFFPVYPEVRERNLFKNAEEHERQLDRATIIERVGY